MSSVFDRRFIPRPYSSFQFWSQRPKFQLHVWNPGVGDHPHKNGNLAPGKGKLHRRAIFNCVFIVYIDNFRICRLGKKGGIAWVARGPGRSGAVH